MTTYTEDIMQISPNLFYDLPDDIIQKIYRIEHSLIFKRAITNIVEDRRNLEIDTLIGVIFFSSNMTPKDIHNWYLYKRWINIIDHRCHPRWLEGLTPDFIGEMERSKYVVLYKERVYR